MISRLFSFAIAFAVAFACTMFSPSDANAQGCQAGTPGCNAPAISQLNLGLANQFAQNSASSSASAVTSPGFQQGFAFQPSAVRLSATLPQPQVQYVQAPPQVQYIQAPPQIQYVQAPPIQYQVAYAAPQVQFSQVPFAVSQAPSSSASSSASTSASSAASSALPLVAAQPVALVSACANGNCGGRQRLLQRKPVSRSISISRSRG